uniref:Mitochondrial Yia6 n=1 Tax=Starmerella bombicola TaxID=75736 RepID=A0A6M8Y7R0_STABO|nr:mitochondrial Yia6 [Starmerella bombicola]
MNEAPSAAANGSVQSVTLHSNAYSDSQPKILTSRLAQLEPHKTPGYIPAISGASAGLVAGVVVCPLDVVKTRLQTQGSIRATGESKSALSSAADLKMKSKGVIGTLRKIALEEGPRSLYNGLTPLLVGYLPSWAIYFYVYKRMQEKLHVSRATDLYSSSSVSTDYFSEVKCAVAAGACSTLATNPIWMIKTRMMAQSKHTSWHYNGIIHAARSIYVQEGFLAFYSGLSSAMLGLPHVAIHFPLYEKLKFRWAPEKQWLGILAASIVSKVVASTITYPHEVIRSRNQIKSDHKYRGIIRTARTLWIEEGWRVFYAGLTANICRAMPASAVTLLTFELVSSSLTKNFVPLEECKPSDPGLDLSSPIADVVIQRDED